MVYPRAGQSRQSTVHNIGARRNIFHVSTCLRFWNTIFAWIAGEIALKGRRSSFNDEPELEIRSARRNDTVIDLHKRLPTQERVVLMPKVQVYTICSFIYAIKQQIPAKTRSMDGSSPVVSDGSTNFALHWKAGNHMRVAETHSPGVHADCSMSERC